MSRISAHVRQYALRQDPARAQETRRLRPRGDDSAGLDRLAELAAGLLGAGSAQISLLEQVQVVAGGAGLAPGGRGQHRPARGVPLHGDRGPRDAAGRRRRAGRRPGQPPPSGAVGCGRLLPGHAADQRERAHRRGAVRVRPGPADVVRGRRRDPRPAGRPGHHRARARRAGPRSQRRPAALGARRRRRRHRHVRLGPRHRPPGLGRPAARDVRSRARRPSTRASTPSGSGCTPTTRGGSRRSCRTPSTRAATTTPSTASSGRTATPAGCTPAVRSSAAPTARPSGSWAPRTTRRGPARRPPA